MDQCWSEKVDAVRCGYCASIYDDVDPDFPVSKASFNCIDVESVHLGWCIAILLDKEFDQAEVVRVEESGFVWPICDEEEAENCCSCCYCAFNYENPSPTCIACFAVQIDNGVGDQLDASVESRKRLEMLTPPKAEARTFATIRILNRHCR